MLCPGMVCVLCAVHSETGTDDGRRPKHVAAISI
jgi:hypothetical protein